MKLLALLLIPTLAFAVSNPPSRGKAGYLRPSVFSVGTPVTVWRAVVNLSGSTTTQDSVSLTGTVASVTDFLIPTSIDLRRQATPVISATCSAPSIMTRQDGSDLWQLSGTFSGSQSVAITYSSTAQTIAKTVTASGSTHITTTFDHYVTGSLARHISDSFTSGTAGRTSGTSLALFTSANSNDQAMTTTTWTRNPSCWVNGYAGFTARNAAADALGWRKGNLGCIPISPLHCLQASHAHLNPGMKVYWVTATGSTVTRTVTAVSSPIISGSIAQDLVVVKLDSALPDSIGFFTVMPPNWIPTKYPGVANSVICVHLNRDQNATVTGFYGEQPWTRRIAGDWGHNHIVGDSGTPICAIVNGALVLVQLDGTYLELSTMHDQINSTMLSLGGTNQLTNANLNGFTSY